MSEKTTDNGLRIPDLAIKGYRGIRDMHIPKLGRVTLITGKNNVGKTSILEALCLYVSNASLGVLDEVLASREESVWGEDAWGFTNPSPLFYKFSSGADEVDEFSIATNGEGSPAILTMRLEWRVETQDWSGNAKLALLNTVPEEHWNDLVPVLVTETENGSRIRRLDGRPQTSRTLLRRRTAPPLLNRFTYELLDPYARNGTSDLDDLWSEIALTDNEHEVVKALRIISPEISAVSMVKGESNERIAIARSWRRESPIPLRSFGDGVNRLFAIVLSLVSVRGGLLLIDEFENGLHHSVQLDIWRMIFRLAWDLDVQVFATTHSQDAVETFEKAASESPGEGSLVLLTRRGDDIIPAVLSERELAIANQHRMQARG